VKTHQLYQTNGKRFIYLLFFKSPKVLKLVESAWKAALEMNELFSIDGVYYRVGDLTDECRVQLENLLFVRVNLNLLKNKIALMTKAKNAYIGDLKSDIVEGRSGVDLGLLFSDD